MTEICVFLGFYAAQTGSLLPTMRTTYWPIFLVGQAEECQEHLNCSKGNGVGGEWFSENVLLANRVSGMGKVVMEGRKDMQLHFLPPLYLLHTPVTLLQCT